MEKSVELVSAGHVLEESGYLILHWVPLCSSPRSEQHTKNLTFNSLCRLEITYQTLIVNA